RKVSDTNTTHIDYDASLNPIHIDIHGFDGIHLDKKVTYDIFANKYHQTKKLTDKQYQSVHSGYQLIYDEDNRLVEEQSPLIDGHVQLKVRYKYDHNNRLIQTTLNDGHTLNYAYDARGQLIENQWYRENKLYRITHQYNADGHKFESKDSDGLELRYDYSPSGLLTAQYYPEHRFVTYAYDEYDRLVNQKDVNGIEQQFQYLEKDKDKLSSIQAENHQIHFFYGRDDNGKQGQLIKYAIGSTNEPVESALFYGAFGQLVKQKIQQGDHLSYEVDYQTNARGQLLTQQTFFNDHNQLPHHLLKQYRYDSLNRLTLESYEENKQRTKKVAYAYDGNNNLIEEMRTVNNVLTHIRYRYNELDQMVAFKKNGHDNRFSITHDVNGRLLEDGRGFHYQFDDNDFLLQVTLPGGRTVRYHYYPDGTLAHRFAGSDHSDFYFNPHKEVMTAFHQHTWKTFLRHDAKILASLSINGLDTLIRTNQSTGLSINDKEALLHDYEAYGSSESLFCGQPSIDFGWDQEVTDQLVDLTWLRNRFFSSYARCFISKDQWPIDNRYAYANANPIEFIDPTGHSAQQAKSYSLGAGFTALGILSTILAVPTGGASLTFSAAAGVASGVTGTLSGLSMMSTQIALDSGNKAAARAWHYINIVSGSTSAVTGGISMAPKIAEWSSKLGRFFSGSSQVEMIESQASSATDTAPGAQLDASSSSQNGADVGEPPDITMIRESVSAAQSNEDFAQSVRDWKIVWDMTVKRPLNFVEGKGYTYSKYTTTLRSGKSIKQSLILPKGLRELASAPLVSRQKPARNLLSQVEDALANKLGGKPNLARQWMKSKRMVFGDMSPILENPPP
ncbi:MAG: hypothetical protein OXE99_09745, partial [Cellvibrionales bacterium]|nr:hypothetical protein [Cellvibrionales bacterium]